MVAVWINNTETETDLEDKDITESAVVLYMLQHMHKRYSY